MENHKNKKIRPVELTCIETAVRGTKHTNIRAECKETAHPTPPVVPTIFDKPETRTC